MKRKVSLMIDGELLDSALDLGIDVSAVAEAALKKAVSGAQQAEWISENADAFARQSEWHERHGHPLADIITSPGGSSWKA